MQEKSNEKKYNVGLVLEGGGVRALYTSGVLDAFMEAGIEFPYVIGVSAGSCNAVSYLGKDIHRMRDITIGYSNDKRYKSIQSIIKNGEYLNSKWIFGELSYEMFPLNYEEYNKSNAKLCVVTTNAKTGKAEYFYPTDFKNGCEELRASCAMPLATRPVKLGDEMYYDGGITDSIPLKKAYEDGCERCVVILTQDKTYKKKPISNSLLVKQALKKFPNTATALLNRADMYNKQREYVFNEEKSGNAFLIYPEIPRHSSTLNITEDMQKKIYILGYKQGVENVEQVRKFISGN